MKLKFKKFLAFILSVSVSFGVNAAVPIFASDKNKSVSCGLSGNDSSDLCKKVRDQELEMEKQKLKIKKLEKEIEAKKGKKSSFFGTIGSIFSGICTTISAIGTILKIAFWGAIAFVGYQCYSKVKGYFGTTSPIKDQIKPTVSNSSK